MTNMNAAERQAVAAKLGISEQYLYQCLTGRKNMRPEEAVRVERDSASGIRRWQVRISDWHLIWPELINAEGAPPVPRSSVRSGQAV
jgi:DNA-binding transcriptional regulator YdaS (Cro superfamily)